MSIQPSKKRKLSTGPSGAKLTATIPIKSALKPPKPQSRPSKPSKASKAASNDEDDDDTSSDSEEAPEHLSDLSGDSSNDEYSLPSDSDDDDGDAHSTTSNDDIMGVPSSASGGGPSAAASKKRKRTDPNAFATSMSKILSSHLTTTARKDPVLSRSTKRESAKELAKQQLEYKARKLLAQEKKLALEKGRIKDVLPKDDKTGEEVKKALEKEKLLRKVAQRGVIKLFNAVRAAQVKGKEAEREAVKGGVMGIEKRKERVSEMSKQGFLDLISGGREA